MIALVCAISVGAAAGACLRAWASARLARDTQFHWVTPTLWVNAAACFFIGLAAVMIPVLLPAQLVDSSITTLVSAGVITGFLGSLSTMSTVSYEAVTQRRRFGWGGAMSYLSVMTLVCLMCTFFGMIGAYALSYLVYLV